MAENPENAENLADNPPDGPAAGAGAQPAVPRPRTSAKAAKAATPPQQRADEPADPAPARKRAAGTRKASAAKKTPAKKSTTAKKSTAERPAGTRSAATGATAKKATAKDATAKDATARKAAEPAVSKRAAAPKPPAVAPARVETPAVRSVPAPAAPGEWSAAAWSALAEPEQPPVRLAELAVAELGPRAAVWVEWVRQTYPLASDDAIARLAVAQAGGAARGITLAGAGGPVPTLLSLPAAGLNQALVVLRIAAAYGRDPADPARVPELLDLLGLTGTPAAPERKSAPEAGERTGNRLTALLHRLDWLPVAIPRRLRLRPLPVLNVLYRLSEQTGRMQRLAHRAVRYYRPGSRASTSPSARSSSSA